MIATFTQYAMIATKWVPTNPVQAFLPFIYNYIEAQQPKDITLENLSKDFENYFELHLPYALLRTILEYLKRNGEAKLNDGFWSFFIKDKGKNFLMPNTFEKDVKELIDGFTLYIGKENLNATPEELISSFFKRYDYEVMSGLFTQINDQDLNAYDYFFSSYIQELEHNNPRLFDFVIKISQGSLIKTAITSENLKLDVLKNKIFYLDTKIIFRLLGYYGEYYQTEYKSLVTTLKNHGAKIYISYYVLSEIESILRGCIRYIESADYQYEKASDVLRYFRSLRLTKLDIETMLYTFESILNEQYGIIIDRENEITKSNIKYYEDYNGLKKILTSKYNYTNDEFAYVYDQGIETDIKSILLAYIKRANNDITIIKNAPLFFVTTNAKLIKSTMQYHQDEYGKTLSPIISDTLLGVITYNEDSELSEYSKLKLLAYCNELYKPTAKQRQDFITQVEKQHSEGKLNDNEVFLLKHYELIDEVLIRQLRINEFHINDDCIFDALDEINRRTTKDVVDSYERKLSEQNKKHGEEINEIKKITKEEIKASNIEHEKYKNDLFESDLKRFKNRITPIYYIFSIIIFIVLLVATLLQVIFQPEWDAKALVAIVSSLLLFLIDLIQLIIQITKKTILKKLIEKKAIKLKIKYSIK